MSWEKREWEDLQYRKLRKKAERLEEENQELRKLVQRTKTPPLGLGFVVDKMEEGAVVSFGGGKQKFLPYGPLSEEEIKGIKPGQYVFVGKMRVNSSGSRSVFTSAITRVYHKRAVSYVGKVQSVSKVGKDHFAEISIGRGKPLLRKKISRPLKEGEKVSLLPGIWEITETYPSPETSRWEVTERPEVNWKDIGGLSGVKKELIRSIVLPMLNPEDYGQFEETSRKILLYGPPGCGKTMCSRALAHTLPNSDFVKIGAGELFSKWLGESEKKVRRIFRSANRKLEEGRSDYLILFFDEIDALAQPRGKYPGSSGAPERVTGQLLDELDGFDKLNPRMAFIGATNRPGLIDSALRSRFDKIIEVSQPDREAGREIAKIYTKKVPIDKYLIQETGSLEKARSLLADNITDALYSKGRVKTEMGTIERKKMVTGRFISQIFRYGREKALEKRSIMRLSKEIESVDQELGDILDIEERSEQLKRAYNTPEEIGVTVELLEESYNSFLEQRAEEVLAGGYSDKSELDYRT